MGEYTDQWTNTIPRQFDSAAMSGINMMSFGLTLATESKAKHMPFVNPTKGRASIHPPNLAGGLG